MKNNHICRRQFIKNAIKSGIYVGGVSAGLLNFSCKNEPIDPHLYDSDLNIDNKAVSIVKINNGNVKDAVCEAVKLLGGIESLTNAKNKIMLKPNLVCEDKRCTTKPVVIETLIQLLQKAGKEVVIGEGSAAAGGFNNIGGKDYQTKNEEILNNMQKYVFDKLDYTKLSKDLGVPLINLHSGEMHEHFIDNSLAFKSLQLHHSLSDIDMLVSVPMMKTHALGTVTLGLKNLLGLYPGSVYSSVRWKIHDIAYNLGSEGVAWEILDIAKLSKLGLTVIDGSYAMEGNGPVAGESFKMDVIIAGTNPFATDMVASKVMGFDPDLIPTFQFPTNSIGEMYDMSKIDIRGEKIENVKRDFKKPIINKWNEIRKNWGNEIIT